MERFSIDSIRHYLKDPLLWSSEISSGYIQYWHNAKALRPNLARMALDFCSAPGMYIYSNSSCAPFSHEISNLVTSVDAEHTFSSGCHQVNFMQTNMSSQTFKLQMAVGSWSCSPLYPGFDDVTHMVQADIQIAENPFVTSTSSSNT
jgi:hypothetical protein